MFKPPHEVKNYRKYETLVNRMKKYGWQGAPLLADGEQLLTGSHRYEAVLTVGIDILQVTDVRELIPDWDNLVGGLGRRDKAYKMALYANLTKEQVQYYGLYMLLMDEDAQFKLPVQSDNWIWEVE